MFEEFVFDEAQVRSGTKKERRLSESCVRLFYEQDYLPWAKQSGFPIRKYDTIRIWLKEIGVKPGKFDKYRCKICFEGREAIERQKYGHEMEGDEAKIDTYQTHIELVHNQHDEARKDKEINQEDTIMFIFDYTTMHELTSEKVQNFCNTNYIYIYLKLFKSNSGGIWVCG